MYNNLPPRALENLQNKINLGSTQKFSANLEIKPYRDEAVSYLAEYLFEYINKEYSSYLDAHPQLRQTMGSVAIRHYAIYDTYNAPNTTFPLLKVYRTTDSWKQGKCLRNSNISIQYALVVPDQEKLMPLLNWVSFQLQKHLLSPSCKVKIDSGLSVQYRAGMNENGQNIYSFIRADITITD
jgi:hypothetical protein